MLEEWKQVFKKCLRSGRICSLSVRGMEGGVQYEWKYVVKKCWRSGSMCPRSAEGLEVCGHEVL